MGLPGQWVARTGLSQLIVSNWDCMVRTALPLQAKTWCSCCLYDPCSFSVRKSRNGSLQSLSLEAGKMAGVINSGISSGGGAGDSRQWGRGRRQQATGRGKKGKGGGERGIREGVRRRSMGKMTLHVCLFCNSGLAVDSQPHSKPQRAVQEQPCKSESERDCVQMSLTQDPRLEPQPNAGTMAVRWLATEAEMKSLCCRHEPRRSIGSQG